MSSILEGIDENSTRAAMLQRLRDAARQLLDIQDAKVGRLQEIEERVRRKHAGTKAELIQITATSTKEEWAEAVDFLENFEDLLPVALLRIHDGAKIALDRAAPSEKANAPTASPKKGGP